MSTTPTTGGERCATCSGSGVHEGKACPTCGGYGHLADGSLVLIPRPDSVTLTREQCEQLLANNGMTSR